MMPQIDYKPTITLGHILQIIVILGSLITAYVSLNSRLTAVETKQEITEIGRVERNAAVDGQFNDLKRDIREVDKKLERLLNDNRRVGSR